MSKFLAGIVLGGLILFVYQRATRASRWMARAMASPVKSSGAAASEPRC